MRLQNIIILPIKVDRIKDDATVAQHEQIRKFVTGCSRRPECLHLGRVQIRCGQPQGLLRVGDEIEVHRGIVSKEEEGKTTCIPIVSLCVKKNDLQFAVRGGPTGVGTHIDPTLMRSDRLVGHVKHSILTYSWSWN
ncbi:hypothetical protein DD238_003474 [Peronospora effusa]|uniref:Uncharacterized protein n=1 Tax=Peronospora effusa TaxID=542832 RepID=A0A3M6VD76_9STRA|nr:hypothetical protein DD238_003474 [Peronospora effusa]